MNLEELRVALAKLEHDARRYRVLEKPDDSTWCIERRGKTWLVFWFERGTRFDLQRFKTEGAACEYFLNQVVRS